MSSENPQKLKIEVTNPPVIRLLINYWAGFMWVSRPITLE